MSSAGRLVGALVVAAFLASMVAGCRGSAAPQPSVRGVDQSQLARFYGQHVEWKKCDRGFECSSYRVPLDYQDPNGREISLQMARRKASGSDRFGALVLNPGGPGGSGVDYAKAADYLFGESVLSHYDVVGVDPRGVGLSSPIQCLTNAQTENFLAVQGQPHSPAQYAAVVHASESFGPGCEKLSPGLTPFVGSVPAARDLDVLRGLLGEQKLNFLGASYGTFLGLTYADIFPALVGRFVLDGVLDPTLSNEGIAQGQAVGFERALGRFVANCAKHDDCPLPRGQAAGIARIDTWLTRLGSSPIPAQPGRALTSPLAVNGLLSSMYAPAEGWPPLREALAAGFRGDGEPMMQIVDAFTSREPDGKYLGNQIDALVAVTCVDRGGTPDAAALNAMGDQWAKVAPTFGRDFAWGNLPCHYWPTPATDYPHAISAAGSGPILLLGTTRDPATPYRWAVAVSKQLANNVLLTLNKDGHTAHGRGFACVDGKVDEYLLSGKLPAVGTVC